MIVMLYPRESESREVKDLSGIWEFRPDPEGNGFREKWYENGLPCTIPMPVPASYNDIVQDAAVRDLIGDVWYERSFYIPRSWEGRRVVLRVGSATHKAVLWVNGKEMASHKGGYLPFEADISAVAAFGGENRVTLVVNNVLDWTTIPPGEVRTFSDAWHPEGYKVQEIFHDFFNYAGIHRPVVMYTTPKAFIKDIAVNTGIEGSSGIVSYNIDVCGEPSNIYADLIDDGRVIASAIGPSGRIEVESARFWEPGNPYLYTLCIRTGDPNTCSGDCYRLPVGIRTVEVTGKAFLINGKPFYFKGFGRHEDMDIAGKGLNHAFNVKDFNLLEWVGANSFRTSHYPYSEEMMDLADRAGIVVIDEAPAVGLNLWDRNRPAFTPERVHEEALNHHLRVMEELHDRDKNHPCVVMWSVANEAATYEEGALPYFTKVFEKIRSLDSSRPVTIVLNSPHDECRVAQLADVICVNRYNSWYTDSGHTELIEFQLEKDLNGWHDKFLLPVIMTEYGADAIAGFHQDPPAMFSEEYQCEMLNRFHKVFDKLGFVVGEHVWNFADFATKQGITRVIGNRKGVFTRQRQPKAAAHLLRARWNRIPSFNYNKD